MAKPQVTVEQYNAGKPFNPQQKVVLQDTGANIAMLSAEEFGLLVSNNVDKIDATDNVLVVNAAQYLAMAPFLASGTGELALTALDLVTIADTGAVLSAMTVEQISGLAANGIDALVATDNVLSVTAAQIAALGTTTLISDLVTLADTRAQIEALTVEQFAALEGLGIDAIDSTTNFLVLSAAQHDALGAVALTAADNVRVEADSNYTLDDDVDNLTLLGTGNWSGTGNAGHNNIFGNSGNNVLDGAGGSDSLRGYLGDDTYITDGDDIIGEQLNSGHDTVLSSASFRLTANLEDLTLTGTESVHGAGNVLDNVMTGNDGDNTLAGNRGQDTLTGGLGADRFAFRRVSDSGNTAETADKITDFSSAEGDKIALKLIDADISTDADDAFTFIGEEAFSNVAGQLRYETQGSKAWIEGDVDGDGAGDFMIELNLNPQDSLAATDFVL